MIDLSARQIRILRAIIEEFIETAQPVGSDTLDKKFSIGVSPATIRNEMVYLTEQGYLNKSHSSAGRVPTPVAMKLYVNELMRERELSVADEVSAKEKIWNSRDHREDLLRQATRVLAEKSHALGLALTTDERKLYHSGYANLLSMPEFGNPDVIRHVFTLIEEVALIEEIFEIGSSENVIQLVYGPELGNRHLESVGIIFMNVHTPSFDCRLGVLGSARFQYEYIVPMMRHFRALLENVVRDDIR